MLFWDKLHNNYLKDPNSSHPAQQAASKQQNVPQTDDDCKSSHENLDENLRDARSNSLKCLPWKHDGKTIVNYLLRCHWFLTSQVKKNWPEMTTITTVPLYHQVMTRISDNVKLPICMMIAKFSDKVHPTASCHHVFNDLRPTLKFRMWGPELFT